MYFNLLAQPATFLRSGGRQFGDEPGSEFVTIGRSGTVATVQYDYTLIPTAEHVAVPGMIGEIETGGVFVDTVEPVGEPRIEGIPSYPGHFIVSAQVADAIGPVLATQLREAGIRLYTPRLLVFPGQPGHPGKDVLAGPYSTGLIRRV